MFHNWHLTAIALYLRIQLRRTDIFIYLRLLLQETGVFLLLTQIPHQSAFAQLC